MTSHHPWSAQDQQNNFDRCATCARMCAGGVGWGVEGEGEREIWDGRSNTRSQLCLKARKTKTPQYFGLDSNSVRIFNGLMCIAAATNAFFTWSQECLSPGKDVDDEEVVDASPGMVDDISGNVGTATSVSRSLACSKRSLTRLLFLETRRINADSSQMRQTSHTKLWKSATSLCNSVSLQMQRKHANPKQHFFVSSPHMPSSCIASQCLLPEELPWRQLDRHCLQQQVCLGPEFIKKCDCVADCNILQHGACVEDFSAERYEKRREVCPCEPIHVIGASGIPSRRKLIRMKFKT